MNKPLYNIYQCNMCHEMEYSYFDDEVHRYCKAFKKMITDMNLELTEVQPQCSSYNHPKGSKKRAKYLKPIDFKRKYYK